jgi:hypothetical protein
MGLYSAGRSFRRGFIFSRVFSPMPGTWRRSLADLIGPAFDDLLGEVRADTRERLQLLRRGGIDVERLS